MQQHSQIIELKDRLVQALDEQLNVKDTNEVNRIISILERTHVTKEDLEKTRLGKYINDLRKRTTDKELAKRAKLLIKTWRDLTIVGSVGSSGPSSSSISALTSPFNSNSISPHGYSVNNNVGAKSIASFYDSKLTPPNHHPALLRIKNQHGKLVSPIQEKTKTNAHSLSPALSSPNSHNNKLSISFRPPPHNNHQVKKNASPQSQQNNYVNENELANGHHDRSFSPKNHQKLFNSNNNNLASNGLSPGLQNFKNILKKDRISPNTYHRKVTPPTSNNGANQYPSSSSPSPSSFSSIHNRNKSDSAPSSQLTSPLAFTYPNESRDSFSNNKNSHSNKNHKLAGNFDYIDEDSNSSQFSNNDYSSKTADSQGKKKSRKRKAEDTNDTLRENFNYVNYGGRRPQSTEELIEKFNIKLDPKINELMKKNSVTKQYNSFSASSSPCLPTKESSKNSRNGGGTPSLYSMHKNGFLSEENSLDSFDGLVLSKKQRLNTSTPTTSPPVDSIWSHSSKFDKSSNVDDDDDEAGEANSVDEDEEFDDYNQEEEEIIESQPATPSDQIPISKSSKNIHIKISSESDFNKKSVSISAIDREIEELYSKLPKIRPEDIAYMQQFQYDDSDCNQENHVDDFVIKNENEEVESIILNKSDLDVVDEEEYEPFEYWEEYDEEIEEEIDENELDNDDISGGDSIAPTSNGDDLEASLLNSKNTLCDNFKCDINSNAMNIGDDKDNDDDVIFDPEKQNININDKQSERMSMEDSASPSSSTQANVQHNHTSTAINCSPNNHNDDDHNFVDTNNDDTDKLEISHKTSIIDNNLNNWTIEQQSLESTVDEKATDGLLDTDNVDDDNNNNNNNNNKTPINEDDLKKSTLQKSNKKIIVKRMVKKRRKCFGRLKVKKSLVDRLANEQWEGYNGCYDKDGIWREWNEMTSAYVLTGGENVNNHSEENVLHILPYVNCSW